MQRTWAEGSLSCVNWCVGGGLGWFRVVCDMPLSVFVDYLTIKCSCINGYYF